MENQTNMSAGRRWSGWGLSFLLCAFMLFSAAGKLSEWDGKEKLMSDMGWDLTVMRYIAIVEIAISILFLIPNVAFLAAILLTAYLGGAVATHVRVHEAFYFPMVLCVLFWIALGLRDVRIFKLAFGGAPSKSI